MAMFGSDWLEDYDPMDDYESSITHHNELKNDENDKPVFAPVHNDEDYDSMKDYEQKLH